MACPTIILGDRRLLILRGFRECSSSSDVEIGAQLAWHEIPAADQLKLVAERNPDAVVFGFLRGRWFAAA